jgi:hypothetical protein
MTTDDTLFLLFALLWPIAQLCFVLCFFYAKQEIKILQKTIVYWKKQYKIRNKALHLLTDDYNALYAALQRAEKEIEND